MFKIAHSYQPTANSKKTKKFVCFAVQYFLGVGMVFWLFNSGFWILI